ncbi:SRPBCC domain-containing protein [Solwaraspora sp. WMMD406]|uniref:SRPBCC family protein n=1 Tax=Solwaraspora sp. WMMD406 TaxID=3016095 RepID=UPI002417CD47|nr:SRPBCC domain-containing protein [Solwaraspora sp. WMMD406]MDG4768397.1 SRPBCC domain-containing protein [Solwaraspora sp. WMMD406]
MTDPVEASAEVTGTPEELWPLLTSGAGISAWFMPAEVDIDAGTVRHRFGPGDDEVSDGTIVAAEAPHRFAYVEEWAPSEGAEPITSTTEFLIEAVSGATSLVRIVSSGFGTGPDGRRQAESTAAGWTQALRVLALYTAHFAGRPSASLRAWAHSDRSLSDVWATLTTDLGLAGAAVGDRVRVGDGVAPPLAGQVSAVADTGLTLLVDEPAGGVASVIAADFGASRGAVVDMFFYGDDSAALVAAYGPAWEKWMADR